MKAVMKVYLLWVLVISNMIYQEYVGLNLLVITVLTIGVFGYRYSREKVLEYSSGDRSWLRWGTGAVLWLLAGVAVFFMGTPGALVMWVLTLFYFVAQQGFFSSSYLFSVLQSIQSFATGLIRLVTNTRNSMALGDDSDRKKRWMKNALLGVMGLTVVIVFLKLYQAADADFAELTGFLNLDWVSWGFLAFDLFLSWILYGLFFYQSDSAIRGVEENLKIPVQPDYTDRVQEFFSVQSEQRGAVFILVVLNAFLLLYLALDFKYMATEFGTSRAVADYSRAVHEGVYSLIASMILVIILAGLIFRGALNFGEGKWARYFGISWLILNIILVITTGVRNLDYVAEFGFTYKRLGVYLYLILCLVGLGITLLKVWYRFTAWYVVRSFTLATVAVFTGVVCFNWNKIIVQYNLQHVVDTRQDLDYLYSLGPDTYVDLLRYEIAHERNHTDLFYRLVDGIQVTRLQLAQRADNASWRSWVYRELTMLEQMNGVQFDDQRMAKTSEQEWSIR